MMLDKRYTPRLRIQLSGTVAERRLLAGIMILIACGLPGLLLTFLGRSFVPLRGWFPAKT